MFLKRSVLKAKINRSLGGNIAVLLFLLLMASFMILPAVYTVSTAFKPLSEIFVFPPHFFAHSPTLNNFKQIPLFLEDFWVPLSKYVFNTIFICVTATMGHFFLSSMAAYPLAVLNFHGKKTLNSVIKLSLLFSATAMLLPQYIVMSKINMVNTYWVMILPQVQSALGLYLMQNFMLQIPVALVEAARMDGANEFCIYSRIVMPNIKPAWLTVMIFSFQNIWNTTGVTQMATLVYDEKIKMVVSLLPQVVAGGTARAGAGAALSLLLIIPPVLIFIICQGRIIETMSTSGMK